MSRPATEIADELLARFAEGCPDYGSSGCECGSHATPSKDCPIVAHRAIYVAEAAQAAARALENELPAAIWLDHVYNGPAIRLEGRDMQIGPAETISGAFHVYYRDDRAAIIGNGEHGGGARSIEDRGPGEGRWLVTMLDRLVKP